MTKHTPAAGGKLRTPTTPRAKATVQAVLDAFGDACKRYGYGEVTTSLVAERAGVSVGAIYQYFANKEAIAIALYEETSSQAANAVRNAIVQNINESISETLPRALAVLLESYRANRNVLIDMLDDDAALREAVRHLSVEDLINRSSRIYIEEHVDEIRVENLEVFRYMLYFMVKGAVREYLINPPPDIDDREFVRQLARATMAYSLEKG